MGFQPSAQRSGCSIAAVKSCRLSHSLLSNSAMRWGHHCPTDSSGKFSGMAGQTPKAIPWSGENLCNAEGAVSVGTRYVQKCQPDPTR